MLGVIRLLLAILVVLNHLWIVIANKVGAHAVIGFYTISGYLMTQVICQTYGDGLKGALAFLANRALRIYPLYLLVFGLSVVFLLSLDSTFGQFYSSLKLPDTTIGWFKNITLWDLLRETRVVVPQAWSLTIEVFFYGSMIALLGRSRMFVWMWFVASLAYTFYLNWVGASFGARYYPVAAASIFFASGALLWVEPALRRFIVIPESAALILLPLFCVFPLVVPAFGLDPHSAGFYGAYFIFLPIFATSLEPIRIVSGKLDKYFGDLAYPIFVSHFMIGGLVYSLTRNWVVAYGAVFAIISLVATFAFSHYYVFTIDGLVQKLRSSIRPRGIAKP